MTDSTAATPETVLVRGQPWNNLPESLFIPPDALRVILESFSGPLDLLLYLIRKQNIDILEVDVAELTRQYLVYIDLMQSARIDLAAEYLLMAAILLEMKSRLLLPPTHSEDEDEAEDPRAALLRRLVEYEQMVKAAEQLFALPQEERDYFVAYVPPSTAAPAATYPEVELNDVVQALQGLTLRLLNNRSHPVGRQKISMRARMSAILTNLQSSSGMVSFLSIFEHDTNRSSLVVSFIAVLELLKERLIKLVAVEHDFYLAHV